MPGATDNAAAAAPESTVVVVVGAGQAGLSASYHLMRTHTPHVVLDAAPGPGGAWRERWDTLTMATVNGIRELPGVPPPDFAAPLPANLALPRYFADYERRFRLPVRRPVTVRRVRSAGADLISETDHGSLRSQALINATGTWSHPFWPRYPGADDFLGRQFHTHDYPGPVAFTGRRVVVIGGGVSAVQLLLEIASVVAESTWVTRRPPQWVAGPFTPARGAAAVERVRERVEAGLWPESVVSVTGLPMTDEIAAARRSGLLHRRPMFARIRPTGVEWPDGTTAEADILLWCTGFRPALAHLAPLRLRGRGGGIVMDGTATAVDPRVQLIGYGPSASTIGANRAGREAVNRIRALLTLGEPSGPAGSPNSTGESAEHA